MNMSSQLQGDFTAGFFFLSVKFLHFWVLQKGLSPAPAEL